MEYKRQIYTRNVPKINQIELKPDSIEIGSAVTINEIKTFLENRLKNRAESSLENAILKMINWFAGDQIRNVASIGGNIMTSSPISDLNQVWMALDAQVEFCHWNGTELVYNTAKLDKNFYTGYRRNCIGANQFITKLMIPLLNKRSFISRSA